MQYTGIAAYPRRVCEYPISFHQLTKIECFGIKGLFIVVIILVLFIIKFTSTSDLNDNCSRRINVAKVTLCKRVDRFNIKFELYK